MRSNSRRGVASVRNGSSPKIRAAIRPLVDALERRLLLSGTLPSFVQASTDVSYTLDNSSGSMVMDLNSGSLVVNADLSTATGWANATVRLHNGAHIYFNSAQTLGDLELYGSSTASVALGNITTLGNMLKLNGLAMDNTSTLDLGDNAMILHYIPSQESAAKSLISGLLLTGYANGYWNGGGIDSSAAANDPSHNTALGWFDQYEVGVVSINGDSADLADGHEIVVKYTVYGDADLDGKIASSDSSQYSAGIHGDGGGWGFCDFNYDGHIDPTDNQILQNNFLAGLSLTNPQYTPALQVTALAFTAYGYTGWSGDIATFTDVLHSGSPASDYVATVDWNDGSVTDAQVTNDSGDSGLRVNVDLPSAPSSSVFTVHIAYDPAGPDHYIGAASSASAVVTLNQLPPGAVASADAAYTLSGVAGATTLALTTGTISFNTNVIGDGSYWQNLNFTVSGSAHAYFNSPENLNALTIQNNAIVSVSKGGGGTNGNLLNVQSLSIDPNATLDLSDNGLIEWYDLANESAAATQFGNWLKSGYANGAWNGPGIDSSVAATDTSGTTGVGWIDNYGGPQYDTFDGVAMGGYNQLIAQYTLNGDADLSGTFDATDVNQYIQGREGMGTGWMFGDSNYDGATDTNDLAMLQANMGRSMNGPTFARAFQPTGIVINPTEGVPFSGDIATFTDLLNPSNTDPSIYQALVNWGDGHLVTAQVTATDTPGSFRINALSPALTNPNAVMAVIIEYADMNDPNPTYQGRPAAVVEPIAMTPAVANLTAASASTSEIDLTWTLNAPNASAIEVDRSADGTNWTTATDSLPGTAASYADTSGLSEATHYYYRIRAIWSAGPSAFTNTADSWTLPNAPSGLSVSSTGPNEIDLSWTNNSAVATQFQIERSDDGTNFYTLDTTTGTTYSDTSPDDGSTYWYRVEALNDNGDPSAASDASSASTALAPPSELTAAAVSASEIDLAWSDDSVTATGYEVDRSTDGVNFSPLAPNLPADTSSYSDTGLAPGSHFYYQVISLAGAQVSDPSNRADDTTTPPSPDSAWATTTSSSVTLNWTPAQGASGYEVDRSVNGNWVDVADVVGGSTTTFTDTGLLGNTTFSYQIISENNAGQSSPMDVSATTSADKPAAPSGLQAIVLSPTSVELVWVNNASNETEFLIDKSDNGGWSWTNLGKTDPGTTNYIDSGLQPGQTRSYEVLAHNSNGDSGVDGDSAMISATTPSLPAGALQPPQSPSNLRATSSPSFIQLSWDPSPTPLVDYWIERKLPGTDNWGVIGINSAFIDGPYSRNASTTFSDQPSLLGVNFDYRVFAANTEYTSDSYAGPAQAMKQHPAPTLGNLNVYPWNSGYKATISWDPLVDPTSVVGYSFSYTTNHVTTTVPVNVSDHAVTVTASAADPSFSYTLIAYSESLSTTYQDYNIVTRNNPLSGDEVTSAKVDSQGNLTVQPSTVAGVEYTDDPTWNNWLGTLDVPVPLGVHLWVRSFTAEGHVVPLQAPQQVPALPPIDDLSAGTIGDNQEQAELYYTWGPVTQGAGAQIELTTDNGRIQDFTSAGSDGEQAYVNPTVIGPPLEGLTYVARIQQAESGGHPGPTGYSGWQDFAPVNAMPAAPLSLTATPISGGKVRLLWAEGSEGESQQTIQCWTGTNLDILAGTTTLGAGLTTWDFGPLPTGNYYFRVRESNGGPDTLPMGANSPWTSSRIVSVSGGTNVSISQVQNAAELGPDGLPQDGYFEVSRTGSTDGSLTVSADLSGTAVLGTQYTTDAGGASPVQVTIPDGASAALLEVEPAADGLNDPPSTAVTATLEPQLGITVTGAPATVNIAELPTLGDVTVTDKQFPKNFAVATDETPNDLYVMQPRRGSAMINIDADVDSSTGEHVLWGVAGPTNSALGQVNDFTPLEITVSLRPTSSNYDFSVFVGIDRNGNGILDQPEVMRTIVVHVYSVAIDQIISDQVPGIEQNSLNGNAGVNAGVPTPKNYLLMGTDASDAARVKVTFTHTGELPPNLGFALCPAGSTTPLPGSSTLVSGDTALIIVPTASNVSISDDWDVVGFGPSLNGDDTSGHGQVFGTDPRQMKIIDQEYTSEAYKFLQGLDNEWATPPKLPTAANFLFAFMNDFAPGLGAINTLVSFTSFTDPTMLRAMHHHVGVLYTSGKLTMDLATYPSTTSLAAQVAKDPEFLSREIRYMGTIAPTVLTSSTSLPPAGTWMTWTPGYSAITLKSNDDYYSIGDAALSGISFFANVTKAANGDIVAKSISIKGTVSDVADFDWDFPTRNIFTGPPTLAYIRQAVELQARYNRTGDPGHVFEVQVQLNNSTGIGWDFTKNKEL